jgi:hypothetical protein
MALTDDRHRAGGTAARITLVMAALKDENAAVCPHRNLPNLKAGGRGVTPITQEQCTPPESA